MFGTWKNHINLSTTRPWTQHFIWCVEREYGSVANPVAQVSERLG